ncbi:lithostathine-1-alpha-like [Gracilinanus agilis]|uniref:lithostathine-1-alpha-like n=1 Tax=Gracilinanus agilis TaxID=191870 RepID=UPI001CFD7468|nr:lithostathine-1-alpha-like [Gracilinanus agilis]
MGRQYASYLRLGLAHRLRWFTRIWMLHMLQLLRDAVESWVTDSEAMLPLNFSGLLLACLLLTGLARGESAPAAAAAALRRSCPEGSKAFGSYCYGYFSFEETWYAAELSCQRQTSGHLASLMNGAEASFVASLVAESGGSRNAIWIGLQDPNKNGRWLWSSTALFTYQAWTKNAPSSNNPGYCATLTPETGFLKWKDQLCLNKNFYICKFKR